MTQHEINLLMRWRAIDYHNQIAEILGPPRDCPTLLKDPMNGPDPALTDHDAKCGECGLPLYRHLCEEDYAATAMAELHGAGKRDV